MLDQSAVLFFDIFLDKIRRFESLGVNDDLIRTFPQQRAHNLCSSLCARFSCCCHQRCKEGVVLDVDGGAMLQNRFKMQSIVSWLRLRQAR